MSFETLCSERYSASWIDFPKNQLEFHLGYDDPSFKKVNGQISDYHQLEKTRITNLEKRSAALLVISESLQELIISPFDEKHFKTISNLSRVALRKAIYLDHLKIIIDTRKDQYEALKATYTENSILTDPFVPLLLVNKILYDSSLPSYWGLYWLEALDPCHRMLTNHYLKWNEITNRPHFFLWLEDQVLPYTTLEVDFFDEEEIRKHTCTISPDDSRLYDSQKRRMTLDKSDEEYLYLITLDKKIVISKGSHKIRHLSLHHGLPVLAAGALKAVDGQILYLDCESGHYQPTIFHMRQAIKVFNALGANLDESTKVKYYHEKKVVQSTVGEFLQAYTYANLSSYSISYFIPDFDLTGESKL